MIYLSLALTIFAGLLLVTAAVAFLKARDVFTMVHVVMLANLYIIPLLLLGIEIEKFSWISFGKTLVLVLLNIVLVNLLCSAVLKRAMEDKIMPDAEEMKKV